MWTYNSDIYIKLSSKEALIFILIKHPLADMYVCTTVPPVIFYSYINKAFVCTFEQEKP